MGLDEDSYRRADIPPATRGRPRLEQSEAIAAVLERWRQEDAWAGARQVRILDEPDTKQVRGKWRKRFTRAARRAGAGSLRCQFQHRTDGLYLVMFEQTDDV